jgi:hypothetical protein
MLLLVAAQVPAEAQGSWKALRALCWCDDDLARLASRHWLQQLLAVTLQQSLKVNAPGGCRLLRGMVAGPDYQHGMPGEERRAQGSSTVVRMKHGVVGDEQRWLPGAKCHVHAAAQKRLS